jgi:NHLM bacteriocin system ABC transporter ATP-binding protein
MSAEAHSQASTGIALSGSRSLSLGETTSRILQVSKGALELFLVLGEPGVDARRQHLATVLEGEWCFDVGFKLSGAGFTILVTGQPGTVVHLVEIDQLDRQDLSARLAEWLSTFVHGISRVANDERELHRSAKPGPLGPMAAGEILGIHQGVCWWSANGAEGTYLGLEPLRLRYVPLVSQGWILVSRPVPASQVLASSEFLELPDWQSELAAAHDFLGKVVRSALAKQEEKERETAADRSRLRQAAEHGGWQDIATVLTGAREGLSQPQPVSGGPSVAIAFQRVANRLGAELRSMPSPVKTGTATEMVGLLARETQLRWREVLLIGRWFARDHGPMIGFLSASDEAVALLPMGSARYQMVRADGTRVRLNANAVAQLRPSAISLYRTLPPRSLTMKDVLRFTIKGSARDLVMIVTMIVITGLLGMLTPMLSARIYDVVIPQSERTQMTQIALILISATIIKGLYELVRAISLQRVENRAHASLEPAIWDRLLRLPTVFFRKFTAGDLANRAQGITTAHQLLSSTGTTILFIVPTGLFNLIVMFFYSVPLALWGLGIALAGTLISVGFSVAEVVILRKQYEIRGKLSGLVFQLINGVAKFRLANAEQFAFAAWAHQYASQERLSVQAGNWRVASDTFFSGFSLLTTGIIFWLVSQEMEKAAVGSAPAFTTGAFLAFNAAFGALIGAMIQVGQNSLNLLRLFPLLERTKPIFEAEPEIALNRVSSGELRGEIEIANIRFSYSADSQPILSGFSLKLRATEMVALVGPSGSGKSTVLRLLLGFEIPNAGSIFYDGKDMQTLDLREVRRQIGVVLQTTRLVTGDIFRNIVGESNLTLQDAWEAAEMAGLANDIRAMPMQMHTLISEGGGGFSGGQRQRLAIARAFAHKPRMLFFDEATSALDNRTQAIVTESLQRMQVTRVIIAHRLSTIAKADRIVALREGRVFEEGTYAELMEKKGFFYELARRQLA